MTKVYRLIRCPKAYIISFCIFLCANTVHAQALFEQVFQPIEVMNETVTESLVPRIKATSIWQLSGINTSNKAQLIIIEIGQQGASYRNRINQERGVLPGAFNLTLYPHDFRTSKESHLVFDAKTRLKIFTLKSGNSIKKFQLTFKEVKKLDTLFAFDLGPQGHAVWQGFESMTPTHPLLSTNTTANKKLNTFSRLSADPLIRDGISGIEQLKIPLPEGKWRLHLWTEDVGYWQTLPELIERRIRINGENRDYQLNTPWQWVEKRYTQNKSRLNQFERLDNLTSWRAIGQYRGGHISFDVEPKEGELSIAFAGANQQATSITAFMIERVDQHLLSDINFNRALWFNARWPLLPYHSSLKQKPNKNLRLSRNNPLFITLPIKQKLNLNEIGWKETPFILEKRLPLPQLERNLANYAANPAGSFLAIKPLILSGEHVENQRSTQVQLMIRAPANLAAGKYSIHIINPKTQNDLAQVTLELLDITLPELGKPIGVYLDLAPHLFLSYERKEKAEQQLICDLKTLSSLSLSGISPPFPLPKNGHLQADYNKRVNKLRELGFHPPFLDYTSLKNLRYQFGQDQTSQILEQLVHTTNLKPKSLAISIADEPSNASSNGFGLQQMASVIDNILVNKPASLLKAAHLNNPKDSRWLADLDIALINQGYGVSRQSIQHIRNQDVEPWLYNMSNKRLAAGFFLWKHKLSGYLQWHARMPTADPFDPTDGREDDQQLLPVMAKVCAKVADLHPDLIAIAEGITDHRWLYWLDKLSHRSVAAFKLRQRLLSNIPNTWQRAENITSEQLQTWRNDIEELALSISKKN